MIQKQSSKMIKQYATFIYLQETLYCKCFREEGIFLHLVQNNLVVSYGATVKMDPGQGYKGCSKLQTWTSAIALLDNQLS